MTGLKVKRIDKLVVGRWGYCGIAHAIKYETWLFDCMNFGCLTACNEIRLLIFTVLFVF